jgi:hypothetical protein
MKTRPHSHLIKGRRRFRFSHPSCAAMKHCNNPFGYFPSLNPWEEDTELSPWCSFWLDALQDNNPSTPTHHHEHA